MRSISIAIPCYEMGGSGADMLRYSLDIIEAQDFKDFEVVIADHSINDDILDLCKQYTNFELNYYRNEEGRGSLSKNMNYCIRQCNGRITKLLCQDDYLFGEDALTKTFENFNEDKGWMVSAYYHTYNRTNLLNMHIPKIISKNFYVDNHIGMPSCLSFSNDNPLMFDENLNWYVDSELYFRLFKRYGEPTFLVEPTVVQLLWNGQSTHTIINSEVVNAEYEYVTGLYENKN